MSAVERAKDAVELRSEWLKAIVHDLKVAFVAHDVLRKLAMYPSKGLVAGGMVALDDTTETHFERCGDANDIIGVNALVEMAVEKDGRLYPFRTRMQEIVGHSGVDYGINGLHMRRALEQILPQQGLLEFTVRKQFRTDKTRQLLLEYAGGAHQALGGCIAVIDRDTSFSQKPAHIRLTATYSTGDCHNHCTTIFALFGRLLSSTM